jgi:Protein of unknown function (DUF2934)
MNREKRIEQRAYEIWESEGRPDGRHSDHWQRAESEVAREEGRAAQSVTPAPQAEAKMAKAIAEQASKEKTPVAKKAAAAKRASGSGAAAAKKAAPRKAKPAVGKDALH